MSIDSNLFYFGKKIAISWNKIDPNFNFLIFFISKVFGKISESQTSSTFNGNVHSETFDLLDGLEMIPDYSKEDLTLQYLSR